MVLHQEGALLNTDHGQECGHVSNGCEHLIELVLFDSFHGINAFCHRQTALMP